MVDYRPERCAYCGAETWCELRANRKRQCRACKVERYFEHYLYPPLSALYPPFGVHLMPWSRKALRDIYGTVDMQTGIRRFRQAYISLAKQNGKSFMSGGLPLYHLDAEYEHDPQVYGAASARSQASIVFKATADLVRVNPSLNLKFRVLQGTKTILRRDGHQGTYEVLSADGDARDGIRGSLNLTDELHRMRTAKAETLRDVLTRGQISRREPLDIMITTAGAEYESPMWYREFEHAKKVQADPSIDPSYYVMIFEADAQRVEQEPDYWKSREARIAANPSHEDLGGHLTDAAIVKELNKAIARPAEKSKYLRYHLNVPVRTSENPIIDMQKWQLCGGGIDLRAVSEFDVEDVITRMGLAGRPCYAGVDASWTTDLTSVVFTFPPFGGDDVWTLLPFFWMPRERLAEIERICRVPLASWAARKFITATAGNAIDLRSVLDRIRWGSTVFDLREVPYDPQHFRTEAMNLCEEGIQAVEVGQNFLKLSYPTKFLLAAYLDGKIRHGNHPVLNWMAACLQLQYDQKDNCQPTKPERMRTSKRIDGIQATVTALSRALVADGPSVYETRGVMVLG